MIKAQSDLHKIFSVASKKVTNTNWEHSARVLAISEECHKVLEEMRIYDEATYHSVFRNCEFFETIGIMVKQNYVNLDDIISRFETGIERVYACFCHHLEERRKEVWSSQLFFIHVGELFNKMEQHRETERRTARPDTSNRRL